MMRRAGLILISTLALVPACKKKARPKGDAPAAAGGAAAKKKVAAHEALEHVPGDAMAVVVAPTIKTMLSHGAGILGRFKSDPDIAAKLAKARLDFMDDTGIDIARAESFEEHGLASDRPLALWVVPPPAPKQDPDAVVLLPVSAPAKFLEIGRKNTTTVGKETAGGLSWEITRSKKKGELTGVAVLPGDKWAILGFELPEDAAARAAKLARLSPQGPTMAEGDLWPTAEAALAPASTATHLVGYLNPARIPIPDSQDAQLAKRFLAEMSGLFMALGADANGVGGKVFVNVKPSARARFAALYQGQGPGVDVMLPIGGTPLFAARMTMNLLALFQEIKTLMGPDWAKVQADIDEAMQQVFEKTGKRVDLEKDVLARIPGRFGMSMGMPDLGALMNMQQNPMMALGAFSVVLTIQVNDAPAIARAMDGLVSQLPQAMALIVQRRDVAGGKALFMPGPGGSMLGGVIVAKDMITIATGKAFDQAVALLEGKGGVAKITDAQGLPVAVKLALTQPDANVIHYDFTQLMPLISMLTMARGGGGPTNPGQVMLQHISSMSMVMRNHEAGFIADFEMRMH